MENAIRVMSKVEAAKSWGNFDTVITIEDPSEAEGLRLPAGCGVRQLLLKFYDVVEEDGIHFPASRQQLEQALVWARAWNDRRLLVHCEMGVSRSAAVALSILADRYGAGREAEAVEHLLAIRPVAVCNPRIVAVMDELLERGGRLSSAWKTADEARFSGGFFIPPTMVTA